MYKVTNISKQVLSVPVFRSGKANLIRLDAGESSTTERIINSGNLSVYLKYDKIKSEAKEVVVESLPKNLQQQKQFANKDKTFKGFSEKEEEGKEQL